MMTLKRLMNRVTFVTILMTSFLAQAQQVKRIKKTIEYRSSSDYIRSDSPEKLEKQMEKSQSLKNGVKLMNSFLAKAKKIGIFKYFKEKTYGNCEFGLTVNDNALVNKEEKGQYLEDKTRIFVNCEYEGGGRLYVQLYSYDNDSKYPQLREDFLIDGLIKNLMTVFFIKKEELVEENEDLSVDEYSRLDNARRSGKEILGEESNIKSSGAQNI